MSSVALYGDTLYAAGDFSRADGNSARSIAAWNGASWRAITTNGTISLIASGPHGIVAAGLFNSLDGIATTNLAIWSGTTWSPIYPGLAVSSVTSILCDTDKLYVGGTITNSAGTNSALAMWTGSAWQSIATNVIIRSLYSVGSRLYAGGSFTRIGGVVATNVAVWDGGSWSGMGSGLPGGSLGVWAIRGEGTNLFAGGDFTSTNGPSFVANWDGVDWKPLGQGVNAEVRALACTNGSVCVGGTFTQAGGQPANKLARWDGLTWSVPPPDLHVKGIYALALLDETNLIAGGAITLGTNPTTHNIAVFNGLQWRGFGTGLIGPSISDLQFNEANLYARGNFTSLEGQPVDYFARWDGSIWSEIPSAPQTVRGMALLGSDVFVGGYSAIKGFPSATVSKWDGSTWSTIGTGFKGFPYSPLFQSSTIYPSIETN